VGHLHRAQLIADLGRLHGEATPSGRIAIFVNRCRARPSLRRTEAAARGLEPISRNFLLPNG